MRKKIAVFANGWNHELLLALLSGIEQNYYGEKPDIFVFEPFASRGQKTSELAERVIFDVPDLRGFDGVILFSIQFANLNIEKQIADKANKYGIPVVSLGRRVEGVSFLGIENERGMGELIKHMIEVHGVKRVSFIAGTRDQSDSNARLLITKQVLSEYGLTLDDDDVHYGDWDSVTIKSIAGTLVDDPKGLPDAIICANDMTALSIINDLNEFGISVPKDVLVTGYDFINQAKVSYPALTSVKQDYEVVGRKCMDMLFSEEINKEYTVQADLVIAESCGCSGNGIYEKYRQDYCRSIYPKSLREEIINFVRQGLEISITTASDIDSLKQNLEWHYQNDGFFAAKDIFVLLKEEFISNLESSDTDNLKISELRTGMRVITAMRDGKLLTNNYLEENEIIPGYKEADEGHTYFIVPLALGYTVMGYVAFADYHYILEDKILGTYASWLSQALGRLRTGLSLTTLNKKLTELYKRDSLSGLFNRFTYDETVVPLFENYNSEKKKLMVCFLDINRMKVINDEFGHLYGDTAIRVVADAIIKNVNEENSIGMRYGGDEFLIVAPCQSRRDADKLCDNIRKSIEKDERVQKLPYSISVSCGYCVTDPTGNKTLQDYIKSADEAMYIEKSRMHEEMSMK